jgi:hypothetical protein
MGKKTFVRLSATLALALAVALLLEVCPGFAQQTGSATPSPVLQKMGVLPFFKGSSGYSPMESLVCPVCQLIYDPETLSPDCDKVLTQYVQEALEKKLGARVLPQAVVARSYEQIPRDDLRDTALTLSQRVGKLLAADFMAVGSVWKYRERVGGARAVSSPASVAFALHLVDVQSGTIVWSKSFVQTQRSLSENLLEAKAFFDQGAKWLTADELASYGVKEIIKEFPH